MGLRATACACVVMAAGAACRNVPATPHTAPDQDAPAVTAAARDAALQSARVWTPPTVPVGLAALAGNPPGPGAFDENDEVSCRFVPETVNGRTPKFHCELPGGDVVKVKYGRSNPEVRAEVAATRLLDALGFGADRMYVVRKVRCFGCPVTPFVALKCLAAIGVERVCFPGGHDFERAVDFEPAVIERRFEGRPIETDAAEGWTWFELDRIDPGAGGSPREDVDALKLLAVFLAHWDNKAENQRLICLPDGDRPDGSCTRPYALIHDLGATFGPHNIDLPNWRANSLWTAARECRVSMRTLPFHGATFPDGQISEEGRRKLLGLLDQLSPDQIRELFVRSGVTSFDAVAAEGRNPDAWVSVFRQKVEQIRAAGPCPSVARLIATRG
jgi:hypothetical protein